MGNSIFEEIDKIQYEGPTSTSSLAYRHYEADRMVMGKTMSEHLRIAICYWHTFCGDGTDMFGVGLYDRPWFAGDDELASAQVKLTNAFAFFERLGTPYFCFHDRDIAPDGNSFAEFSSNINAIVEAMGPEMERTGVRLLWGTANLFTDPRYAAGAATNPDPAVYAYAAAQVKQMLDVTHALGGENYVLWGGREGYDTLLNTDLGRESDQLGRFMASVVEYKNKIGFKGTLLIEPKPHEPTTHQYDHDSATVHSFLQKYDLANEFKLNIEANHATLSGHSFAHELRYASAHGILGSIDFNRGDPQLGWDTDQFPNDVQEATLAMLAVLEDGGFTTGGSNFDAKLRRQSLDAVDLFHAHIGGIDILARGLVNAAAIIEGGELSQFVSERYAGWDAAFGKDILSGATTLDALAAHVVKENLDPKPLSGRQELLENIVNRYL